MDAQARKAYQKAYYEKNKGRLLEAQRKRSPEYYQRTKEAAKVRAQKWKEANPERIKELQRLHSEKNRDVVRLRSKNWYLNNKERASANAREVKLRSYGMTNDAYQSMLEGQGHRCAICGAREAMEGKNLRMYVDHCHKTGKVRGLLCQQCNVGIGTFKDDPKLLMKAADYLTRSSSGATLTTSNEQLNVS